MITDLISAHEMRLAAVFASEPGASEPTYRLPVIAIALDVTWTDTGYIERIRPVITGPTLALADSFSDFLGTSTWSDLPNRYDEAAARYHQLRTTTHGRATGAAVVSAAELTGEEQPV
jgi:hypothetical protein